MDGKELRGLLSKRLYNEIQFYKDAVLQEPKEESYKSFNKIEVLANALEILLGAADGLNFDELKAYVDGELGNIAETDKLDDRKGAGDGQ